MIFERIIRLPWWLFAAVSALFFALAVFGGGWAKERGGAIRAVMERPSAPVTSFAALDTGGAAYAEAAFEAQIVTAGVRTFEEDDAGEGGPGVLVPLAAPDATEPPERLAAAIFVEIGPMRPEWQDWIAPFVTGEAALGPLLSLEGEIARDHEAQPLVRAALGAEALRGTIWVRPYREGRAEALERNLGLLGWGALPFWGIGIFFAVMAAARFFASRG